MDVYYKYAVKIYSNKLLRKIKLPSFFDENDILERRKVLNANNVNRYIYNEIIAGNPFFVGRFGGTEVAVISDYLRNVKLLHRKFIRKKMIYQLYMWSGFFTKKTEEVVKFVDLMIESCTKVDCLARWWGGMENYLIEEYAVNAKLTSLPSLEPWQNEVSLPWSAALKGKKVLVIHPFEDSIKLQYRKRKLIFANTYILPEFELKTLKAVQTIAGQKDERFESWFDALEYMYTEAMKIDFDIAIIGCGAYGFPLAAKIKQAGKQAIHLAGATQILFGIKGKRWESVKNFGYLQSYFNENWIYPLESDVPSNAQKVENGCYWE